MRFKIGDKVVLKKPINPYDFPGWRDVRNSNVPLIVTSISSHYKTGIIQVNNEGWWYSELWATNSIFDIFKQRLMC